jgi:N-glycosylase/DNA lyase
MNSITADRIREAVVCIAGEIAARVGGRPRTTPTDDRGLWMELTCCVLSSQVPYDLAKAAALRIDETGVLCKRESPEQEILRQELVALLSTPFPFEGRCRRYRFPNIRANQIAAAFWAVREEWGSLSGLLTRNSDARLARSWLVENVPGVGPKQASMFLRNVAGSFDLAILDRHVLHYMRTVNLCSVEAFQVTTIGRYERYEIQLQRHAESLGHAVGLLDWAIWIVMRTASRIDRRWAS